MSHTPATRAELITLVRQWHQDSTPWIPSGHGTRLDWGPALDPDHAVLSCQQLNQVIDHAVDDLTITVEAGLPLVGPATFTRDAGSVAAGGLAPRR